MEYFHVSKMSKFTHYAADLRKFPTEAADLQFPLKFFYQSYNNSNILDTVSLLYFHTFHTYFKFTV